jgi:hypothetical protein
MQRDILGIIHTRYPKPNQQGVKRTHKIPETTNMTKRRVQIHPLHIVPSCKEIASENAQPFMAAYFASRTALDAELNTYD